jgi:hypothetical protein
MTADIDRAGYLKFSIFRIREPHKYPLRDATFSSAWRRFTRQ